MLSSATVETILIRKLINLSKEEKAIVFENIHEDFFQNNLLKSYFNYEKECYNANKQPFPENFFLTNGVPEEKYASLINISPSNSISEIIIFFKNIYKDRNLKKIAKIGSLNISQDEKEEKIKAILSETEKLGSVFSPKNDAKSVTQSYKNYIADSAEKYHQTDGMIGISTKIKELDLMTKGVKNRDYIIVAARPSMGKTSYVLNPFIDAIERGLNPVFLSIEMPKEQIMARMLSVWKNIPLEETMYGAAGSKKIEREIDTLFQDKNFWIEDFSEPGLSSSHGVTISDINKVLRKIATNNKIGLIIVDFMQLIVHENPRIADQNQVMTGVSTGLKRMTATYDCPMISLSQLNRQLETRVDKRPIMSDLRSSGSIEQDADIIKFLYRPEVYLEQELKKLIEEGKGNIEFYSKRLSDIKNSKTTRAEIIVGKNRNGPIGTAYAQFVKNIAAYKDSEDNKLDSMIADAFGPVKKNQ